MNRSPRAEKHVIGSENDGIIERDLSKGIKAFEGQVHRSAVGRRGVERCAVRPGCFPDPFGIELVQVERWIGDSAALSDQLSSKSR